MKKLWVLLVLACLLLTAGCAKKEEHKAIPASERAQAGQAVETPAPAQEPEPTPVPTPVPTPTPEPTPAGIVLPPLPDIDINSWEFLYAGPHCGVGRYHPRVGNLEGQYMDKRCTQETIDFLSAARAQGFEVYVCVAYRNWEYTTHWYEQEMFKYGEYDYEYNHFLPGASYEAAKHGFAAGCSEHSTGLAFDITDESIYEADWNYTNVHDETVAGTPVCKWMDEHCAEYGFIIRYPKGKQDITGYKYESWHVRYLGKQLAQEVTASGHTLEEFLCIDSRYQ
jgi:LAS superfamily LD-carboxypeptidase LdcB